MLLFSESKTKSSPLGDTSTEYGSIPSLLPSNTVSTEYPPSNFIIERVETAEISTPNNIIILENAKNNFCSPYKEAQKQGSIAKCGFKKRSLPVLVLGLSDQSHFTSAETTLETTPLTISAYLWKWQNRVEIKKNKIKNEKKKKSIKTEKWIKMVRKNRAKCWFVLTCRRGGWNWREPIKENQKNESKKSPISTHCWFFLSWTWKNKKCSNVNI